MGEARGGGLLGRWGAKGQGVGWGVGQVQAHGDEWGVGQVQAHGDEWGVVRSRHTVMSGV